MSSYLLFGIALGLAMDAFAVAIATSIALGRVSKRQLFRMSFHFGLFQAFMPLAGWLAGSSVGPYIRTWDHWVAFGLLTFVGGKAIYEAYREEVEGLPENKPDPTRGWSLVVLSTATSVDALAVGLSFAMLNITIWYPCVIIGLTAAVLTLIGMLAGSRLGAKFGERIEVVGGAILILIGLKILLEHFRG